MYIINFNQQNIEYLKNNCININCQIVLSEMIDPSLCYNNFINILNDMVKKIVLNNYYKKLFSHNK